MENVDMENNESNRIVRGSTPQCMRKGKRRQTARVRGRKNSVNLGLTKKTATTNKMQLTEQRTNRVLYHGKAHLVPSEIWPVQSVQQTRLLQEKKLAIHR